MEKIVKGLKIILGSLLIALSLNLFFKNTNFVPSGIYGFSIIYYTKTDTNLALIILLANVFFAAIGWLMDIKKKIIRSIFPFVLIPLLIHWTSGIDHIIDISGADPLLIVIFGGAFFGLGYRFIFKEELFANPSDIVSHIEKKCLDVNWNLFNYIFDIGVVFLNGYMFGIENALYSLIAIIIIEVLSQRAYLGTSDSKVFYIITKKEREVRDFILDELKYELTIFDVKGGFLKNKNTVLMSVIPTRDYYKLREGIKEIDPSAFISITDSYEVINGNKNWRNRQKNNLIEEDIK